MNITFLGTSSMHPTKDRAQTGMYVHHATEKILVDCGEGIQRQMRIKGIAPPRMTRVFITHEHNDHLLGFPGLLENLSHAKAKGEDIKPLHVYGPKGIKKKLSGIAKAFGVDKKIDVVYTEITKDGTFLETPEIECSAHYLSHSVPCVGYRIKEKNKNVMNMSFIKKNGIPKGPIMGKLQRGQDVVFKGKTIKSKDATEVKEGKKVSIVLDTKYCKEAVSIARDADMLVIESTFDMALKDRAKAYKHLTAEEASKIAKEAKAKHLVLTHFSQRYDNGAVKEMKKQAEQHHNNVTLAEDFMDLEV